MFASTVSKIDILAQIEDGGLSRPLDPLRRKPGDHLVLGREVGVLLSDSLVQEEIVLVPKFVLLQQSLFPLEKEI